VKAKNRMDKKCTLGIDRQQQEAIKEERKCILHTCAAKKMAEEG